MPIRRIRYWLRRDEREASLRAEMESHIEEHAAELIAGGGMTELDARAEARRRFGNFGAKQEESRETWIARHWWDLYTDIRYAARNLRAQPGFAAVVLLSASLGIGACSTVFGIVNFAMFRPLPVEEPSRLMSITSIGHKGGAAGDTLSYPEILEIRKHTQSWKGVAAFRPFVPAGIGSGGPPQRSWGFVVSANYFDVVRPGFAAGRGFVDGEDDAQGAPAKVVLAHSLWAARFGSDPGLIGHTIHINRRPMTVVGVTRPGFRGTAVALSADFFVPFSQISELDVLSGNRPLTSFTTSWLEGIGRLKDEEPQARAQAELNVLARGILDRVPDLARDRGLHAEPAGQLAPGIRRVASPSFLLLLTAAFLVLLIACANVANLMLARASARSREIATRLALGASRGRLIRQLLTESILLALAGGLFGILLTEWASRNMGRFRLPMPLPFDFTVSTDYRVVIFCAALSVFTSLVFGLVPALCATRPDLIGAIKGEVRNIAALRRFGLRNVMVVTQVAVSAALLVCSGLFLRSLSAAGVLDTGIDPRNVLLVPFDPALSRFTGEQTKRFLHLLLREAAAAPGVLSASVTNMVPLSITRNMTDLRVNDRRESTAVMTVGPGYFATLGIPLLAGEDFRGPSPERTVIVSEELARRLYPGRNALGLEVLEGAERARIVGIAANTMYRDIHDPKATPILYKPILDTELAAGGIAVSRRIGLTLIVKTQTDAAELAGVMRRKLIELEPELIIGQSETMEGHVRESMFFPRMAAAMFGLCGGMGLLIASIGVYGVISFSVARRTREIGIRMALGARTTQVMTMVLRHGLAVTAAGIVAGLAAGLVLARLARSMLFGVSPTDPLTFLAVPLLLLVVALAAAAIPARRAAMVDPSRTLRSE